MQGERMRRVFKSSLGRHTRLYSPEKSICRSIQEWKFKGKTSFIVFDWGRRCSTGYYSSQLVYTIWNFKKKKRLVYLNSVTSHFHSKVYWLISFIFIIFSLSMVDLAPFVNNKATSNFISLAFYLKTLS